MLVVDDVITAGTAIREAFEILEKLGATPAGVVIALDRQVRNKHRTRTSHIVVVVVIVGRPVGHFLM